MKAIDWKTWMVMAGAAGLGALGSVGVVVGVEALAPAAAADSHGGEAPRHKLPPSQAGDLVVGLCDGETALEVKGTKPGQPMPRAQAQTVATALMDSWQKKNPQARWDPPAVRVAQVTTEDAKATAQGAPATAGAKAAPKAKAANVQSGHTYKSFAARDEQIWKASVDAFVTRGHKVFHDAKELGGTTGISCDMCHPDGSNTHPETYPKYQVQMGRVALLRDMINWCLENPVRAKPLPDGDERLRAMEAYLYAQRRGTPLDAGKH